MNAFDREVDKTEPSEDPVQGAMAALVQLFVNAQKLETKRDAIKKEISSSLEKLARGYWEQLNDTLPRNKRLVEERRDAEKSLWQRLRG